MVESSNDNWTLTSYCKCKKCCGKDDGVSASGRVLTNADEGKVCAAPSSFPFGTVLTISGGWSGRVTVVDRGGDIHGKRLDIYMSSHQNAINFGRKSGCSVRK